MLCFPRCQDEPFRNDICPVSSFACSSSRFRPHAGRCTWHGEVRLSFKIIPLPIQVTLVPDISTSTSVLWLPQKMSRYCTIFLEKQRLSVIQNHIFTARFANLQTIPHTQVGNNRTSRISMLWVNLLNILSKIWRSDTHGPCKVFPWRSSYLPAFYALCQMQRQLIRCSPVLLNCPGNLNFCTMLNPDSETSVSSFGGTGLARPGQVGKTQCNWSQGPRSFKSHAQVCREAKKRS